MQTFRHALFTALWFVTGLALFAYLVYQLVSLHTTPLNIDRLLLTITASGVAELCFYLRVNEWTQDSKQNVTVNNQVPPASSATH
jgi:hypothetical protein